MRKYLFCCTSLFFIVIQNNAQVSKGAVFLGGDIGFSTQQSTSSNNINSSQKGVSVSPVFGKAIKDNLILGLGGMFSHSNDDFTGNTNDRKANTFGLSGFLRKYRQIGKSDFLLFLQGSLGGEYYKSQKGYNSPSPEDFKQYRFFFGLYPGISYSVNKKLQIETGFRNLLSLNYIHGKGKINNITPVTYTNKSFNIYSSLENLSSLYIGFRLLINR